MTREIQVVTPENVLLTYQPAGAAARFAAALIDMVFQVLLLLLVLELIQIGMVGGLAVPAIQQLAVAGGVIAAFAVVFIYAIFFEMMWGGQTPGKRFLRLRAVRDGGFPLDLTSSAVRNVLRFVDYGLIPLSSLLVLVGLPGLIAMFFSPQYKRIGDFAAGTIVILDSGASPLGEGEGEGGATLSPAVPNDLRDASLGHIDRLTEEEYRVIRRFVARRADLPIPVQAGLGEWIARPIMQRLDSRVTIYYQLQFADTLEAIEREYARVNHLI